MKNEQQHIDDFFRNQLKGDETPLAGDEWGKIFEELHPPKKRRFIAWWWISAFVLLALGAIGLFQWNNVSNLQPDTQSTSNSSIEKNSLDKNNLYNKTEGNQPATKKNIPLHAQHRTAQPRNSNIFNPNEKNHPVSETTETASFIKEENGGIPFRAEALISLVQKSASIPYHIHTTPSPFSDIPLLPTKVSQLPQNEFYVRITASGLENRQLLQTSGDNEWVKYRKNNEENAYGWQTEILLGYKKGGLEYSTGLALQQSSTTYGNPPSFTYQLYDSIPVYDSNGNIVDYLKFNYRDTIRTNGITNPSYTSFGIPLKIGKEIPLSNKWSIKPAATLRPGILVNAKGNMLDKNLQPSMIYRKQFNPFTLQASIHFGLVYSIDQQWDVSLDAVIQYDMINALKSTDVSQRFNNYGTTIGLTYKLFER